MFYNHLLLLVLSLLLLDFSNLSYANQHTRVACYFDDMNAYRRSLGRYDEENIPAHFCTTQLRQKHPHLKLQIGVGGWGSTQFQRMVAIRDLRQTFIHNLINFTKNYDFDGLDLYWALLGDTSKGGIGADKDNFLNFVQELRHAVDRENLGWEITMTAPLQEQLINNGYHVHDLCELLDAVNTMGFNFHGPWDDFLDVHSPLYKRKHDKHPYEKSNVNDGLMIWEERGCPPSKLVLGLTFYARTYGIDNSITSHSIGTIRNNTMGKGRPGPYSRSEGLLAYYEICTEIMASWKGLKVGWDDVGLVPYVYNDTLWGGYENERSVQLKMDFVKGKGYGGAMAWQIDSDDFLGLCGTKNILLKTIYDNMKNYNIPNGIPNTTTIPVTSPSPVVQEADKTTTLESEPQPETCTNGIVVPHTDHQKYIQCIDGKLMEFECTEGTKFNTLKNICERMENIDSVILTRNGTIIYFVNHLYIKRQHV